MTTNFAEFLQSLEACPEGQEAMWVQDNVDAVSPEFHVYLFEQEVAARQAGQAERAQNLSAWVYSLQRLVNHLVAVRYIEHRHALTYARYSEQHFVWLLSLEGNAVLHEWETRTVGADPARRRRLVWLALEQWLQAETEERDRVLQRWRPFLIDIVVESVIDSYLAWPGHSPTALPAFASLRAVLPELRASYAQRLGDRFKEPDLSLTEEVMLLRALLRTTIGPGQCIGYQFHLANVLSELYDQDRTAHLLEAQGYYQQVLDILDKRAHPDMWANSLNGLANMYQDLPADNPEHNVALAIKYYQQALEVLDGPEHAEIRGVTYHNLGDAYSSLPAGNWTDNAIQAIECYEQALVIFEQAGLKQRWAMTLNNLGSTYRELPTGDWGSNVMRAIECYESALGVYTEPAQINLRAQTLNNLGTAIRALPTGDQRAEVFRAVSYHEQALSQYTQPHQAALRAKTLNLLGIALRAIPRNDPERALDRVISCHEQALHFYTQGDFPEECASTLDSLGNALSAVPADDPARDLARAIRCYEQALLVYTKNRPLDRARVFHNMALALGKLPDSDPAYDVTRAIACYEQALSVYTDISHPQMCRLMARNLGVLLLEKGRIGEAIVALQQAERAADNLWAATGQGTDKEQLARLNAEVYELLVMYCLHPEHGNPAEAFNYAAKSKGRTFSDALSSARVHPAQSQHAPDLAEGLASLHDLREQAATIMHLLLDQVQGILSGVGAIRNSRELTALTDYNLQHTRKEQLQQQLEECYREQKQLTKRLARRHPQLFATQVAPTLNSDEAQQLAAKLGAPLIEYYRHAQGWVAFVVLADQIVVEELPEEADAIAAEMRGWVQEIDHFLSVKGRPGWSGQQTRNNAADLEAFAAAFVWPILPYLPPSGPLVLAPNQVLHGMPLQAATLPNGSLLSDSYALSFIPSLAALAVRVRQQQRDQIKGGYTSGAQLGPASVLAISCPGRYPRLEHVEFEADTVSECFDPAHVIRLREGADQTEQQATVERVIAVCQSSPPTVLYAGCHGLFQPAFPNHSGLQLQDKWLDVERIINELPLHGVELVALAACQSGQEHLQAGDELVGLPQALLTAGAGAVLVSHWSVADEPTSHLITVFFDQWQRQGQSLAQALQLAMRAVREHPEHPEWSHPYYWSPFRLIGSV